MNPLTHTLENQFHGAANATTLRELYQKRDYTGLLEYPLLLAEQEACQRSQIQWLMREVITAPVGAVEPWHMAAAQELSEVLFDQPDQRADPSLM